MTRSGGSRRGAAAALERSEEEGRTTKTTPERTGGPLQWHPVSKYKQFFLVYTELEMTCLIYNTGSELWGGQSMTHGVLLIVYLSRYAFTTFAERLRSLSFKTSGSMST